MENPAADFILSKLVIDAATAQPFLKNVDVDDDSFVAMRAVFIKHWMLFNEGRSYLDRLTRALSSFLHGEE